MYGKTKTQSTLIEVEDVKIKNVESSASEFRQKYQTRSDDNGDVAMPSHKQMLDVLCMVFDKGRHTKRHMISLSLSLLFFSLLLILSQMIHPCLQGFFQCMILSVNTGEKLQACLLNRTST